MQSGQASGATAEARDLQPQTASIALAAPETGSISKPRSDDEIVAEFVEKFRRYDTADGNDAGQLADALFALKQGMSNADFSRWLLRQPGWITYVGLQREYAIKEEEILRELAFPVDADVAKTGLTLNRMLLQRHKDPNADTNITHELWRLGTANLNDEEAAWISHMFVFYEIHPELNTPEDLNQALADVGNVFDDRHEKIRFCAKSLVNTWLSGIDSQAALFRLDIPQFVDALRKCDTAPNETYHQWAEYVAGLKGTVSTSGVIEKILNEEAWTMVRKDDAELSRQTKENADGVFDYLEEYMRTEDDNTRYLPEVAAYLANPQRHDFGQESWWERNFPTRTQNDMHEITIKALIDFYSMYPGPLAESVHGAIQQLRARREEYSQRIIERAIRNEKSTELHAIFADIENTLNATKGQIAIGEEKALSNDPITEKFIAVATADSKGARPVLLASAITSIPGWNRDDLSRLLSGQPKWRDYVSRCHPELATINSKTANETKILEYNCAMKDYDVCVNAIYEVVTRAKADGVDKERQNARWDKHLRNVSAEARKLVTLLRETCLSNLNSVPQFECMGDLQTWAKTVLSNERLNQVAQATPPFTTDFLTKAQEALPPAKKTREDALKVLEGGFTTELSEHKEKLIDLIEQSRKHQAAASKMPEERRAGFLQLAGGKINEAISKLNLEDNDKRKFNTVVEYYAHRPNNAPPGSLTEAHTTATNGLTKEAQEIGKAIAILTRLPSEQQTVANPLGQGNENTTYARTFRGLSQEDKDIVISIVEGKYNLDDFITRPYTIKPLRELQGAWLLEHVTPDGKAKVAFLVPTNKKCLKEADIEDMRKNPDNRKSLLLTQEPRDQQHDKAARRTSGV